MNRGICIFELLVVLAISAILVAIAVPNFIEAQERKKITQVYSDLRTNAVALEAYAVDHVNRFPPRGLYDRSATAVTPLSKYSLVLDPIWVTTPVAYLSDERTLIDPFQAPHYDPTRVKSGPSGPNSSWILGRYRYVATRQSPENAENTQQILFARYGEWRLTAAGPDTYVYNIGFADPGLSGTFIIPYDATNGVVSVGDIARSQREPEVLVGHYLAP